MSVFEPSDHRSEHSLFPLSEDEVLENWLWRIRDRSPWNEMYADDMTGELRSIAAEITDGCPHRAPRTVRLSDIAAALRCAGRAAHAGYQGTDG